MMKEKLAPLKGALLSARRSDADIAKSIRLAKEGILDLQGAASLLRYKLELFPELVQAATAINRENAKGRIEFYAVSYVSDKCVNSCAYCGHSASVQVARETLTSAEMALDFHERLKFGPTEICILAGQHPTINVDFLINAGRIAIASDITGSLQTVSFNVAPMKTEEYRHLKEELENDGGPKVQIRVFQETYDENTYLKNHPRGPKHNFSFRLASQERAMEAGIGLVGVGALFGLNKENAPYEHIGNDFELLSLISHAFHLKGKFGIFPSTASLPRHQKSEGSCFSTPNRLDDIRYILYHAIMRIFLPETKIIVTSRERGAMKDILRPMVNIEDLAPRSGVGGNFKPGAHMQNELGDTCSPEEAIEHVRKQGFAPAVSDGAEKQRKQTVL